MLLYSLVLHYITKINKYSLQITSLDILLHDFPLNIFMYIKYSCEYGVIMIYLFGKIDMFEDVEVLYVKYLCQQCGSPCGMFFVSSSFSC